MGVTSAEFLIERNIVSPLLKGALSNPGTSESARVTSFISSVVAPVMVALSMVLGVPSKSVPSAILVNVHWLLLMMHQNYVYI